MTRSPAEPDQHETVTVPGGQLWTATTGSGPPTVLCHGGPGLSDNLGPLAGLLSASSTVHRYDQRGNGRSTRTGPLDVATFVADLEALRRHWSHERWVVGGHSWGAVLALFYAVAHPDRTAGVVAISFTGTRWGWQDATRRHRLARLSASERSELEHLERRVSDGSADAVERARFLRLMGQTDFVDRDRADAILADGTLYAHPRAEDVFRSVSADERARLGPPFEAAIARVPCPVLVVHGEGDADPSRALRLAELAPGGELVVVPDAGHSPWLERPDAVASALTRFVDRVSA